MIFFSNAIRQSDLIIQGDHTFIILCLVLDRYIYFLLLSLSSDTDSKLKKVVLIFYTLCLLMTINSCKYTKKTVKKIKYILDEYVKFQVNILTIINLLSSSLLVLKKHLIRNSEHSINSKYGIIGSHLSCCSIDQQSSREDFFRMKGKFN